MLCLSDVIMPCRISAYSGTYGGLSNIKWSIYGGQEKDSIIRLRIGSKIPSFMIIVEKSVPRDGRLSSLGKPRDAKRRSLGRIFLSHIPTHTRSRDPYVSSLSEKSVQPRYPCEISVTNTR